jgi:MFS family permease
VVLIAANYEGTQQAQAFGWLGAAEAMAGVLAFLVAGSLDTWIGWRYSFGLLCVLAVCVLVLGKQLKPVASQPDLRIDKVGMVLAALAIVLISLGFNNTNSWGLLLSTPVAPFSLYGLSPAPVMIIAGILLGQTFIAWSKKRRVEQKTPLIALEVVELPQQRSAVLLLFIIVGIGSAVSFLIPLYIQIVQGHNSLRTALAIIPYALSIVAGTILVLRLYDWFSSRQITRGAFVVVAVGMTLLDVVIRNEWETFTVIFGLIVIGLGQGALVTLLFTALAITSPKALAGDVGALRGTAANLAGAMGTAIAGSLLIGLLSTSVMRDLVDNPVIPPALKLQVDPDNITFVSNDHLQEALERTTATPQQVAEALRINTEARLRSLKICFLVMTGLALLAIVPAGGLPNLGEQLARLPVPQLAQQD